MYARAAFIGRATKDCDVVELPSGMIKANLSIATNVKKDETAFFDLIAFDKLATTCGNYIKKGKLIYAECNIQPRTYEKDGYKKHVTDYIIKELKLLSSNNTEIAKEEQPKKKPTLQAMDDDWSDVPF